MSALIAASHREAVTRHIQVGLGVYGLQDPQSQTRRLPHVGKNDLLRSIRRLSNI
jgi:hypothetical protein